MVIHSENDNRNNNNEEYLKRSGDDEDDSSSNLVISFMEFSEGESDGEESRRNEINRNIEYLETSHQHHKEGVLVITDNGRPLYSHLLSMHAASETYRAQLADEQKLEILTFQQVIVFSLMIETLSPVNEDILQRKATKIPDLSGPGFRTIKFQRASWILKYPRKYFYYLILAEENIPLKF
ncbi:hypothetical protein ABEB36_005194 [Hypothenemus hampei]|uniref:Uncharacterized protein n=1 Tax=Hypothenemus hampei TaxID=57062 RepID=A0ABD1EXC7_HYPHA